MSTSSTSSGQPPPPNHWCHKCEQTIYIKPSEDPSTVPACPRCGDYFVETYTPPPELPAFRDSRQYSEAGNILNAGGIQLPLLDLHMAQIARANELRRRGSSSEGPPAASSGAPPSSASAPAAAAAATTTAAAAAGRSASADRADSDPSSRPPRVSLRRAQGADGVTVHQLVIEGDGEGGESRSGGGRARDREQSEMPGRMMLMNLMQMLHGGSGGLPGGLAGLFMAMGAEMHGNPGDYASESQMADILQQMLEQDNGRGPPPLSEAKRRALPRRVLKADSPGVDTECPVCREQLTKGQKICILPCHHFFHEDCILPWLGTRCTCPLCRYDIEKNKAAE